MKGRAGQWRGGARNWRKWSLIQGAGTVIQDAGQTIATHELRPELGIG